MNDTNGMLFRYDNLLPINTRLIIDTLGRKITNNYVNAYSGFSISEQSQTNWMRLEPGANAFKLFHNGLTGSPTIGFRFLRHYI